jgi:uncharacterized BrkB/YihY/UPF0761 family membrane protein
MLLFLEISLIPLVLILMEIFPLFIMLMSDDTLVVLPFDPAQIAHLKDVLQSFTHSTGLRLIFGKSFLVPINVEEK